MGFLNCASQAFSNDSIRRSAPSASGVYGISSAREWIYLGESDDIQARLLEHLAEKGTALSERLPAGFSFELCPPAERTRRHAQLVQELRPACKLANPQSTRIGRR